MHMTSCPRMRCMHTVIAQDTPGISHERKAFPGKHVAGVVLMGIAFKHNMLS